MFSSVIFDAGTEVASSKCLDSFSKLAVTAADDAEGFSPRDKVELNSDDIEEEQEAF
jgi:hypothetical protein